MWIRFNFLLDLSYEERVNLGCFSQLLPSEPPLIVAKARQKFLFCFQAGFVA